MSIFDGFVNGTVAIANGQDPVSSPRAGAGKGTASIPASGASSGRGAATDARRSQPLALEPGEDSEDIQQLREAAKRLARLSSEIAVAPHEAATAVDAAVNECARASGAARRLGQRMGTRDARRNELEGDAAGFNPFAMSQARRELTQMDELYWSSVNATELVAGYRG